MASLFEYPIEKLKGIGAKEESFSESLVSAL